MSLSGKIHSIDTFNTIDGPGIRIQIFFQGCPLRCKYCHNRDMWNKDYGINYTTDEIINEVLKYKSYIFPSGGGMTVSGGEATMQPEFLNELFKKAKEHNIHTCLDTSGFVNLETIKPILENTDLVILDIKHMNDSKSKLLTGATSEKARELAIYLDKINKPVWIRHVLVPGITDDVRHLIELSKFVNGLNNVEKFEFLPYHTMGVFKWYEMGVPYELVNVRQCTEEDINRAMFIFNNYKK